MIQKREQLSIGGEILAGSGIYGMNFTGVRVSRDVEGNGFIEGFDQGERGIYWKNGTIYADDGTVLVSKDGVASVSSTVGIGIDPSGLEFYELDTSFEVHGGRITERVFTVDRAVVASQIAFKNEANVFALGQEVQGNVNISNAGVLQIGGTTVIDASRNLLNIGTITSGLINGQKIDATANFTGTVTAGKTTSTTFIEPIQLHGTPTTSLGWSRLVTIHDNTALAANVGGGIGLSGFITATTSATLAGIRAGKDNATSGQTGAYLSLGTRVNGGGVVEGLRISSTQAVSVANHLTVPTNLTLSNTTVSRLLSTDGSKVATSVSDLTAWIAGTANQVVVTDDLDGTVTLSLPQNIHTGASPSFAGLNLSSLTASRLLASDGTKNLVSTAMTSWIAGTVNQITVTDDTDGSVTLSLPQDIHTGASPTFVTAKFSGLTDGKIPYHVADATGLADSPLSVSGDGDLVSMSQVVFQTDGATYRRFGSGDDIDTGLYGWGGSIVLADGETQIYGNPTILSDQTTLNLFNSVVTTLNLGGAATTVNLGAAGGVLNSSLHVNPALTDTYDIGSYTKLWRESFISQMNALIFAENTISVIGG